jgi:hypothetical protein
MFYSWYWILLSTERDNFDISVLNNAAYIVWHYASLQILYDC